MADESSCVYLFPSFLSLSLFCSVPIWTLFLGSVYDAVPRCVKDEIIDKLFPLQNKDELNALSANWYRNIFTLQPLGNLLPKIYIGHAMIWNFEFDIISKSIRYCYIYQTDYRYFSSWYRISLRHKSAIF